MSRRKLLYGSVAGLAGIAGASSPVLAYFVLPDDSAYVQKITNILGRRVQNYEHEIWSRGDARPNRVILVRHGQTHGYSHTCDCSAAGLPVCALKPETDRPLTEEGRIQALQAGVALREIIGNETTAFFCSPYQSCKQTFQYIGGSFDTNGCIIQYDPRLRNQDFGDWHLNTPPEKKKEFEEQAKRVGKFYYRWEGGESTANVFDRASNVIETLYRKWAQPNRPENFVLVTHSVVIQCFLMRWFHWDVDTFNRLHRLKNGQIVVMEKQSDGSYMLASPLGIDGKKTSRDSEDCRES